MVEKDGTEYATPCQCQIGPFPILEKAGVPERLRSKTLGQFKAQNVLIENYLKRIRKWCETWPKVDRGLLIMGPTGTGKTHVSVGIMRELAEKGECGMVFKDSRGLMQEFRDTYQDGSRLTESVIMEDVTTCPLLVLDDLGAERLTEWTQATMEQILSARYNAGLPVIITTNWMDSELLPDGSEGFLVDRVGARVRSRLWEVCQRMGFLAPDYREQAVKA